MSVLESRLAASVDAAVDGTVAGGTIVGMVVRIALDGQPVYGRAAGLSDREAGTRMREDALFRVASVSKQFVSATALALIERGRVGLDDPATRYLPAFRPKLADGSAPDILVRHLLTHTAGLTYGFVESPGHAYHRANVSDGLDQPGLPMEENLRRVASVPLAYPPGTAWGYSVAIDVLGAIIAKANRTTLGEAVAEYVTGPLGLRDTSFAVSDASRLVTPYADGTPPIRMGEGQRVSRPEDRETALVFSPSRVFDPRSFQSGGAGLNGTAADATQLLEALRLGGAPILKAATLAMALTNQIGDIPREAKDAGQRSGFLGNVLVDPAEAKTPQGVGTFGIGGAWGHSGFVDPTRKLTVVALTNTAVEGVSGAFPMLLRDAIYAALG